MCVSAFVTSKAGLMHRVVLLMGYYIRMYVCMYIQYICTYIQYACEQCNLSVKNEQVKKYA